MVPDITKIKEVGRYVQSMKRTNYHCGWRV